MVAVEEAGPIESRVLADVRPTPLKLPPAFQWSECDMRNPTVASEVYDLLTENYVEDDDCMFRFDYSREFLSWALTPPGFNPKFHLGVRMVETGQLYGFISGVPSDIVVYGRRVPMVEINFLCVHKKLRSKRLAPVLIKEITRRVNLTNVWQAVYTAGVVLPKPVSRNRYWHRSLNPSKLIDVGFSRLAPQMTMARTVKRYALPAAPLTPGLRDLRASDVPEACALLCSFLERFKLHQHFTEAEFAHFFLPREGVVDCLVVEDPTTHKLTDLISFYHLPSTVIGHPRHKILRAAYSYYNVSTATPWPALMTDALIVARNRHMDVFNALDVMENSQFFTDLKFGIGDGNLQYYLYNWRCPEMQPSDMALVLQ